MSLAMIEPINPMRSNARATKIIKAAPPPSFELDLDREEDRPPKPLKIN